MNFKKRFRFPGQAISLHRSGVSSFAPRPDQLSGSNTAQKPPRTLFSTLKGHTGDKRKEVDMARVS